MSSPACTASCSTWDTDFKTFHQLKSIIERLESIADACAENAELLRHLALEYLDY